LACFSARTKAARKIAASTKAMTIEGEASRPSALDDGVEQGEQAQADGQLARDVE